MTNQRNTDNEADDMDEDRQSAQKSSHKGSSDNSPKKRGGSGNFADDPNRASEAGRKGGERSHGSK